MLHTVTFDGSNVARLNVMEKLFVFNSMNKTEMNDKKIRVVAQMTFFKRNLMSFKVMIGCMVLFVGILDYIALPKIIETIKNNPEIKDMRLHPDFTYSYFKECTIHVVDANRCYNAYSAAVDIANAESCTPSGIELKRKFKHLVEHAADNVIEDEIKKECAH